MKAAVATADTETAAAAEALQPKHEQQLARLRWEHRQAMQALQDCHAESKSEVTGDTERLRAERETLERAVLAQSVGNAAAMARVFGKHADFLHACVLVACAHARR